MVRVILTLLLSCAYLCARAQFGGGGAPDYERIKRSTLLVVLDPKDQEYNKLLRKAVSENWCISTYAFINEGEFTEKIYEEKYTFLKLIPIHTKDKMGETVTSTNLSLLQGGKVKARYQPTDVIVSSNMNLYQKAALPANVWRSVTMINNYVKMLSESGLARSNVEDACLKYSEEREKLEDLTLLVSEEDLDDKLNRKGNWEELYPYPIRIVDQKEIQQAILNKRKGLAYTFIFQAGGQYIKCIARASDNKILYAQTTGQFEKRSDLVSEKFLRDLSSR